MSKFEEHVVQCFCAVATGRSLNPNTIKTVLGEITRGLLDARKQVPTDEDKSSPK